MTDLEKELLAALKATLASLERADTSEGVCCCGDSIESHNILSGHSPVDMGDYYAGKAMQTAEALITKAESQS